MIEFSTSLYKKIPFFNSRTFEAYSNFTFVISNYAFPPYFSHNRKKVQHTYNCVAALVPRIRAGRHLIKHLRNLLVGVIIDHAQQTATQIAVHLWQEQTRLTSIEHVPEQDQPVVRGLLRVRAIKVQVRDAIPLVAVERVELHELGPLLEHGAKEEQ